MIELAATRATSTTFAVAVGAAMLNGPIHYPARVEPYEIQQVSDTHSDFMENLFRSASADYFTRQIAAIYNDFAMQQGALGTEFETAIFSDLEGLYEA